MHNQNHKTPFVKLSRAYLEKIGAEQGPSFYLLDATQFRENYEKLNSAFRLYYPNTKIAYSYKTNYIPRFCELVDQLGGYAEVVSSMEMTLARRVGVIDRNIFFNGPYKEPEYVFSLLEGGGTINVDSLAELEFISRWADTHDGPSFKLGLRCNFDVCDGVVSRFGFDVNGVDFEKAIGKIDAHDKLELCGLHCHFATRSLSCWENRTKGMIQVIDKFFRNRIEKLKHISLGGGIYGYMPDDLKSQFSVEIPSFENYAAVAALPFMQYLQACKTEHRPTLIIEPGTALVADALKFVCTVNSIKHVQGGTIVSLSGSTYNINPTPNRKNVPIGIYSALSEQSREWVENANFGGYTCIEGDYLYKGYKGPIAVGDYVVFDDIGSYSVVMKPPFILPNVAIVELNENNQSYKLIKRAETFDDIFHTYNSLS